MPRTISPVAGVGIDYAIRDAVVATNILAGPLKAERVAESDLAEVQRLREWPRRVLQTLQSLFRRNLVANVLASQQPARVHWQLRALFLFRFLRDLPARLIAFGHRRVRRLES